MVISKFNISRLDKFLNTQKWRWLTKLYRNNLKFNLILRPTDDSKNGKTQIEVNNLSISEKDYRNFVNSDLLSKYNQLSYHNFKPLE